MTKHDHEQRFPLTALIIILVFIVLISLVLMSVQNVLPPSPTEKTDNNADFLRQTAVNDDSLYFYKTIPQEAHCSDAMMVPPLFGKTVLKSMDHYDLKEYKEAEDLLRTLHLFYPGSALVVRLLGNTLFAREQYADAERYYIKALRMSNAKTPVVYNDLAMSQAMQGKYTEAIRNMKRSINYSGGAIEKSEWNLAGLYLRAGQKEESLKLFISLLKRTPAASLKNIKWDPVFHPLLQEPEVRKVLQEKTGKDKP